MQGVPPGGTHGVLGERLGAFQRRVHESAGNRNDGVSPENEELRSRHQVSCKGNSAYGRS